MKALVCRLSLLFALFVAFAACADDFDLLRQKWGDYLTGGTNLDLTDPDVKTEIAGITNSANNYWSTLVLTSNRTCLWTNLASVSNPSHITSSYSRLQSMALAYAINGSTLQSNAALATDIVNALDWLYTNRYNEHIAEYGNWWEWEIGSPMALDDISTLMYPVLSPVQLSNYMNAVNFYTPVPETTGANLIWKARVVGVRAALVKDAAKLVLTRDAFSDVFPYVTTSDGYYRDGSFIQHGNHPYTGGYGASLLSNLAPLLPWLKSSPWEIVDPAQTNVINWIYNTYQPIIYRGAAMDMVRGREISRSSSVDHGTGHGIMLSIFRIAQFAPPADTARMLGMVKYWAQVDSSRNFTVSAPLTLITPVKQMLADTNIVPRGELLGHYTFADMDRVVHLRPGFGVGLSMFSTRIYNYESINGENLRAWYTGQGMTYLYNGDLTQFSDSYWPTIDPYRLPGTTVEGQPRDVVGLVKSGTGQSKLSSSNWVGGATLGLYGSAGMQVNAWNSSLVAKKSWFMFDKEVVCLGADINCTNAYRVESIVENRKLNDDGNNPFTVNGAIKSAALDYSETVSNAAWAHLAGNVYGGDLGYYFPANGTLKALREARTGSWSQVNTNGSTNLTTRNYLTLYFDHGTNPVRAAYAYALLPNHTAAQVADYAANPAFDVLENSARAQAVRHRPLGLTMANFWTNGLATVDKITADKKCAVILSDNGTYLEVGLADPTQTNTGVINLEIASTAKSVVSTDAGVTVGQLSPTIKLAVNVNNASGQTLRAKFFVGSAQTVALAPVADAYVQNGDQTNANFGASPSLVVKLTTGNLTRQSFLRFDLSSISGPFVGATLQLMPTTVTDPVTQGVALVTNNSWAEMGITWNNQPAAGTNFATWSPELRVPVQVPVTAQAQAALAGDQLLSLRIATVATSTNGFIAYGSRESTNPPLLLISLGQLPPAVTITNPVDPSRLLPLTPFTLAADVQAGSAAITNVAFILGATNLGQASAAPYVVTASGLGSGEFRGVAVATDANGLNATSAPVTLTVASKPSANPAVLLTPRNNAVTLDLWTLANDSATPASNLLFTVGGATNGTVALQADGHTVKFTPTTNFTGPGQFTYTVTGMAEDPRTLLHYSFEPPDDFANRYANDNSGNGRYASFQIASNGLCAYTNVAPFPAYNSTSVQLSEFGGSGGACLTRDLSDIKLSDCSWTMAAWFQRATQTNEDYIFYLGGDDGFSGGGDELQVYGVSGSPSVRVSHYNAQSTQDATVTSPATIYTNQWHHVALVFQRTNTSAGILRLYLNGVAVSPATNVAWALQQAQPLVFGGHMSASRSLQRYFNGRLDDVVVFTNALDATEISRLATRTVAHFGGLSSTNTIAVNINTSPSLAPLTNRTISAGMTLLITNTASDPDVPPQKLSWSLLDAPLGAAINSTNGLVTWRPAANQAGTTNALSIVVADNGTPVLSATQSCTLSVRPLNFPRLTVPALSNGQYRLTIGGDAGLDYVVLASTNLSNWVQLQTNLSASPPLQWSDPAGTNLSRRFYRVRLAP